jgi:hypothetical protein
VGEAIVGKDRVKEGIVARGEPDYVYKKKYFQYNIHPSFCAVERLLFLTVVAVGVAHFPHGHREQLLTQVSLHVALQKGLHGLASCQLMLFLYSKTITNTGNLNPILLSPCPPCWGGREFASKVLQGSLQGFSTSGPNTLVSQAGSGFVLKGNKGNLFVEFHHVLSPCIFGHSPFHPEPAV